MNTRNRTEALKDYLVCMAITFPFAIAMGALTLLVR